MGPFHGVLFNTHPLSRSISLPTLRIEWVSIGSLEAPKRVRGSSGLLVTLPINRCPGPEERSRVFTRGVHIFSSVDVPDGSDFCLPRVRDTNRPRGGDSKRGRTEPQPPVRHKKRPLKTWGSRAWTKVVVSGTCRESRYPGPRPREREVGKGHRTSRGESYLVRKIGGRGAEKFTSRVSRLVSFNK